MKKAIIYARQSSGKDDYSESVERQKENCIALAKKENLEVIGIFSDLNTSGKTYPEGAENIASLDNAFNAWFDQQTGSKKFRNGLGKALAMLSSADYLIVDESTRLYRPVTGSYLENYINNLLIANQVKILQCKGGNIDLTQFDQKVIQSLKNQLYDEQIAKGKIKSMQQLKARRDNGFFANGGGKAFGTFYDRNNGNITIQDEYVPVIQFVFNSIANYMPTMQVLKALNANYSSLVAKCFYQSHIYNIASNPVYAGYMFNSDGLIIANKQVKNPCIDFQTWQKVQTIMQNKKKGHRKEKYHWLPLSGLLYCGYCGARLLANTEKRQNSEMTTYICHRANNLGIDECRPSRINYSLHKDNYTGIFEAIKPLLVISLFDMMDEAEKAKNADKRQEELQVAIANANARNAELIKMVAGGYVKMADIQSELDAIKAEINACNAELMTVNHNPDATTRHFEALSRRFKADSFLNDELDHATYESLLQRAIQGIYCYAEHVTVKTAMGDLTIPRFIYKNKRNMPVADLIVNGKENMTAIVIYKTGKKSVLADWGRLKVITR